MRIEAAHLREQGFTLLEVLIAMFLLVLISLSIYNATTQTFKYREILVTEGDFYNGIRLAMGIFERDFEYLYSPIFVNPNATFPGIEPADPNATQNNFAQPPQPGPTAPGTSPQDAQALEAIQNSELGQVTDFWLPATDLTGIRPSRVVGEASKLTFVTSSHARLYKGSRESTFAKVTYELRNDNSEDRIEGTKVLVRVEDPNVFDDVEKRLKWQKTYPLLTGVKSLKFRYYRKDTKTWENTWDNGKENQKDLYPDLVEVSIEVTSSRRLNFAGTYTYRPEMPYRGLPKTF